MEDKDYLLALCQCSTIGPSRLSRLRAFFNSWDRAWKAPARELFRAGLDAATVSELAAFRRSFSFQKMHEALERYDIRTVTPEEADYPKLLKQIHLPPLLYYRGSLSALKQPTLAIVGSRKTTPYGLQATEHLASRLARTGLTIISGLALGIDTCAHAAALDAEGMTVAVLGCGLDTVYPSSNRRLAERICERGCLISEFRPGTPAYKTNFPRRNRLIAGLSLGTLVIEAAEKSGALITAQHALNDNREVMAVPGNIFSPLSAGTNALLRQGAKVILSAADALTALGLERSLSDSQAPIPDIDPSSAELLKHISYEPLHVNELARLARLDISSINSRLTIMELNGLVKNTGNLSYVRLQ